MNTEKQNVGDGSLLTPDGQALIKKLNQSGDSLDKLLQIDPKDWTKDDVAKVQKAVLDMSGNDPRRNEADEKVRRWYDITYGTAPVETDATGRMMQPEEKTKTFKSSTTPNDGIQKISGKLGELAGQLGEPRAASILQTGLNLLGGGTDALKVDGDIGPKTKGELDKAIATKGTAKVAEGVSLARFEEGLKESGSEGLDQAADQSFSDLFPPSDNNEPKAWNQSIQDTINGLGRDVSGAESWVDVTDDGWLGPKSKEAFDKIIKSVGPRAFIERMGREMNFLA